MNKENAYKILGIDENASEDKITRTYYALLKDIANNSDVVDSNSKESQSKEQLEQAYNTIMKKEGTKNKISFKNRIANFIYYYGIKIAIAFVVLLFIIYNVLGSINKPNVDLNVVLIGKSFYGDDLKSLDYNIKNVLPEIKNIKITQYGEEETDQQTYLIYQKISAQISLGEIDIMITDKQAYDYFSKLQCFDDLEPVLEEINDSSIDKKIKLYSDIDEKGIPKKILSGLDLTEYNFMKINVKSILKTFPPTSHSEFIDNSSTQKIISFAYNSKKRELCNKFLKAGLSM